MERAGLPEKRPMKRKERGSKWKSLERERVEQGKKGVSLVIKPPHAEVPWWMPHSWTVKLSNRHWGDFSTASSGQSLLITTKCSTTLYSVEKKKPEQSSRGQKYQYSKDLGLLSHSKLNFVALATKTNYVKNVCHASLATSLWNRVFAEHSLVNNYTLRQEFGKNKWVIFFFK